MATEGCVSSRTILWWLVFTGTAMNYITRMSINIAIVSMVKSQAAKHDNVSLISECFNASIAHPTLNNGDVTGNATGPLDADDENRVSWDEYEQGLVLGSPYWLYWATQLPSSMVAHRYGSKIVFGLSNYIMCVLGILIPFATFNSFYLLIAIRVLQGVVGGFVWPVLHAITAAWVPPNERSKFITAYTDSNAMDQDVDIGSCLTGILSGIPHIMRVVFAFVMSIVCDYLLRTNKMSRTSVRKLAIAVCCLGQCVFNLGMAFSGCNSIIAIVCMILATACTGVDTSGQLASMVDLSPNFASFIMGISNTISVMTGFLTPLVVGFLTFQNQTSSAWQMVFLVSALMVLVPDIFHLIFGTSEVQEWNYPVKSTTQLEEIAKEKEKLNPKFEENDKNNTRD
uniref:Major facilitator superfamily (MFS) profile domain-containing protein n=1 Tax=Timema poppense TaxID=170557 RepID=A0A7R9CMG1_TIMPO|nr:unnamed protein product [Timema poppensis]